MGFLKDADFLVIIESYILEQVIGRELYINDLDPEDPEDPFTIAKMVAEEECYSYLAQRYDADQIFAATGTSRNPLVVMKMADVALFHLHSKKTPNSVPEVRKVRYDDSIDWFAKVASGKVNPRLPEKILPDTGEQELLFRMGSQPKFNSEY